MWGTRKKEKKIKLSRTEFLQSGCHLRPTFTRLGRSQQGENRPVKKKKHIRSSSNGDFARENLNIHKEPREEAKCVIPYEYLKFQPLHITSSPFGAGRASKQDIFFLFCVKCCQQNFHPRLASQKSRDNTARFCGCNAGRVVLPQPLPYDNCVRKAEDGNRQADGVALSLQKPKTNWKRAKENEGCVRSLWMFCPLLAEAAHRSFRYSGCRILCKCHNVILAVQILV